MPLFSYRALTANGESITGEIEAPNKDAVVSQLHEAGHIPISTEKVGNLNSSTTKSRRSRSKGLSQGEVQLITGKLALMLRAGLPLDHALELLSNLVSPGSGQQLLEKVRADVQNGAALSEAMSTYPETFNKLYISTLKAGETAGALDTVLERLDEYLERSRALKDTIITAMIYPLILLSVAIISIAILLIYVVPQFSSLYDGMGQAMPIPTAIVIGISSFVKKFWWLILGLIFISYQGFKWILKKPFFRQKVDQKILKIPLISDLIKKVETARFSRTLGTLSANGVPLLASLNIVSDSVSNSVIADALTGVSDQLREGKGMAKPLSEANIFPQLAVQLIQVGEETGELEKMLNQLADIYDNEVQETVKRLLAFLEPALIIGLGILIAGIIISVLLGILGLNDLVV
ncbi:MAG: type II secretion system F family protein [Gammaproteobacteria bacterium]